MPEFTLQDLEAIIKARKLSSAATSYTKFLLDGGTPKITKKLGEEAVEVIIAANMQGVSELKGEMADLLFHMMVLLAHKEIPLEAIVQVLKERTKESGHEEKASRAEK
jgi:phosphoribosyl-ATP pyrophosphohydrolase